MQGHFDSFLNLRKLMLERRPGVVVECGAGDGALTRLLAHMTWFYPVEVHVISDKEIEGIEDINFVKGISYRELAKFPDDSIDMCIIDTDHNYWTLRHELEALHPKLRQGGLVAFHDVEEFYYNTGMSLSYWDDSPYPKEEIEAKVRMGGVGLALIDWLHEFRGDYKLLRYVPEHCGAAVIEKRKVTGTSIVTPGIAPVFAKPVSVPA